MVFNLRPCNHVTPELLKLHWLPITERIDFKLCLLVHKALVGHAPQYIADLIRTVADLPSRLEPRCGQHLVAICMETERLPLRPRACGIVYLLTSNSTDRRLHLSNVVLKLYYLTGASLNICNDSVMRFQSFSRKRNINALVTFTVTEGSLIDIPVTR